MSPLRIMILCGRSPRHLYVANALCAVADVQAIVQETGNEWNAKKVIKQLQPVNLTRKAWRWLRDRRRTLGTVKPASFSRMRQPISTGRNWWWRCHTSIIRKQSCWPTASSPT